MTDGRPSARRGVRVAIDARRDPTASGGIAPAMRALVAGLGRLDGPEEYDIVVGTEAQLEWLRPAIGSKQRLTMYVPNRRHRARGLRARLLQPIARHARPARDSGRWPEVPISDGFHEGLACDVVHFPTQSFVLCALPSIYNPHDLQHLHYPQFFTARTIAWRETVYPVGCRLAHTVVVGSRWVKDDVVWRYAVPPAKVQVIREGAYIESCPEPSPASLTALRDRYGLAEAFALYPAVTWPNKNHLRLLEAVAYLRDQRGLRVIVTCTGSRYQPFWPRVEARITELRLSDQVRFLGFVPEEDLRGLYRLATCLVLPSLFEANSLPIFEAWLEGVPVACSNVTGLPEQVTDAACLFDPHDVGSIADALSRMMADADLRQDLRARGHQRLKDFDVQRTVKAYRAVYRRAAGIPLTEEDRWLLGGDVTSDPQPGAERQP